MLRGHRTYLSLFDDPEPSADPLPEPKERKGRSEELHTERNVLLIHRYYYLVKLKGRNYHDTLSILQLEFFISQRTITNTVDEFTALLKELNATKPELHYFKAKYPHLIW